MHGNHDTASSGQRDAFPKDIAYFWKAHGSKDVVCAFAFLDLSQEELPKISPTPVIPAKAGIQ